LTARDCTIGPHQAASAERSIYPYWRVNYNLADFFIIGATPVFLLARRLPGQASGELAGPPEAVTPAARNRPRARVPALADAGVILVVALGAARYAGVTTPRAHVSAEADRHARTIVTAYNGACDRPGASAGTPHRALT
jgi:hypothetical protein